jgi:hypothetical protein
MSPARALLLPPRSGPRAPWPALLLALPAAVLAGCGGPGLFEDAAERQGLEFVSYSGDHLWYLLDTLGSGAAAGDYDADGDPDLFLLSGHAVTDAYREKADRHTDALWRNDGGGRFTDVTLECGIGRPGWSNGAVFADYDGDGDLDLYVVRHGPNLLWRNDGGGRFTEVAATAGVDHAGFGAGAAFGDLDADGDLDLYVTNYVHFDLAEEKDKVKWFTDGLAQFPHHFEPEDNVLYRNNGDGTFTDITLAAGVRGTGRSLGVLMTDHDADGDLDIFVANDIGFNNLFENRGGGSFEETGLLAGVACNADGKFEASMGVAGGDYDGDGDIDLIVTNYAGEQNTLYRNEGGGFFTDATREAGLYNQRILDCVGWGVGFHDFDLDGHLDLLVVNGHVVSTMVGWYMRHFAEAAPGDVPQMRREAYNLGASQPKLIFFGREGGVFEERADAAGREITGPRMGRGAAFADFDGDGRIDVAVTNKNQPAQVLLNRVPVPATRRWVMIELRAPPPNVFAVGAQIRIQADGKTFLSEVHAGTSYLSASDLAQHFGLGEVERIDRIIVRWPDGVEETFPGAPLNQRVRIEKRTGHSERSGT